MCGGTPAEAEATIRARGVRPWRSTASPLATTIAEAPSESGDALPAVTMPSALKAGLSLASASALVSARGTSSVGHLLALAGLDGRRSRAPAGPGAAAVSCCERRPQASESSRLMPSRTATSSAVSPRLIVALPPSRSLNLRVDQAPAERGVGHVAGGRPRPRALGQDHRRARHRLDAAGHDDVGLAAADLLRRRGDGLQAAGAQPVDGVAGDLVRQAGQQRGHARDVAVVLAGLVGGAEDHLVDRVVGDAGALERGAEDERGEVVGARVGEGAAIAPEGRADAADEKGIGHAERSKRSVSRERTATISSSLIPCSWSS